jgi:hypothetical protein
MKENKRKQSIVWGGLLIVFGVLALVQTFINFSIWTWVVILGALGLGVFAVYLSNRSNKALLIPVYIFWVVAIFLALLALELLQVLQRVLVPSYVMFTIAIPFLAAYLWTRKNPWLLLPGGILAIIGFAFLIAEASVEYIVPTILILAGIGILLRQFLRGEPTKEDIGVEKHQVE